MAWPLGFLKAPQVILIFSEVWELLTGPVVLKLEHAAEFPGGLIKNPDCRDPPPEFLIQCLVAMRWSLGAWFLTSSWAVLMLLIQGPLTDSHWWMMSFALCTFLSCEGLWKGKWGQAFWKQDKWTECPLCIYPIPEDCGTLSWDAVMTGSLVHCFFLLETSSWLKSSARLTQPAWATSPLVN